VQRRYKIAYILSSFMTGGKELILLNVMRKMDSTRFEPILFVAKGGGDLLAEVGGNNVYVGVARGNVFKSLPSLWRMLARERPDIVWCVAADVMGFAGRLFAYLLEIPVVIISLHGKHRGRIIDWPNRLITGLTTDRVVTTSEEYRKILLQEGVPEHLLTVLYNGIDTNLFQPSPNRTNHKQRFLGAVSNPPVIGTVGNLLPVKAHDVFLKAVSRILPVFPNALFVIVGEGPSRMKLEALCRHLGIQERVLLVGLRKDIPDLLRSFDMFVLTSYDESFGNAIIEAMASGLPVVGTAVGGVPELVTDATGILVPAGNDEAVAEAVIGLLRDPARREAMGQAGRRRAVEHFNLETMIRKREALLLGLLEKEAGEHPVQ
jgi:glycosyltransferase involved in cell wall biosynthesis